MPTHLVNLDALITREDFEASDGPQQEGASARLIIKVEELHMDRTYFSLLRKPDFQRPTNNWSPDVIVDFVKSFLDGELIPALILWHSRTTNKVFVIDGAHRLSALIGWVNEDYGAGPISRKYFGEIQEGQIAFHNKTAKLMADTVGTFSGLSTIGTRALPTDAPEKIRRGRAISVVVPATQTVEGNADVAASSFLKINTNQAPIDPTELDVIRARRKPNAIATRALMKGGMSYWSRLPMAEEIEVLAKEVYSIIFGEVVSIGAKSPDIPRGGQPYSHEAFTMVLDMVNMCNSITPAMWQERTRRPRKSSVVVEKLADDADGSATVELLEQIKSDGTLVSDNGERKSGSLGLDPAVYCYGATGKFHPAAFLASLKFAKQLEAEDKIYAFTEIRSKFEDFLVDHNFFINQIGHSKGSRTRPLESVLTMYRIVFESMVAGVFDSALIVKELKLDVKLKELNDTTNIPVTTTTRKRFSKSAEAIAVVRQILKNRERCTECGARLPPACRSKDHKTPISKGGTGSPDNLAFTHPYCNTGYKNRKHSEAEKAAKE